MPRPTPTPVPSRAPPPSRTPVPASARAATTAAATAFDVLSERIDELTFHAGPRVEGPAKVPAKPALRRIVVAVDGRGSSAHAMSWARELARVHGAKLWVTTVVPPRASPMFMEGAPMGELYAAEAAAGQAVVDQAVDELRQSGVLAESVLASGSASREIARLAHAEEADLIILGSHGHGALGRVFLGSVADQVKNLAACSVLIAKGAPRMSRILLPTDGSTASKRAAALALALAKPAGSKVTVAYAVQPPSFGPLERGRKAFEFAMENLDVEALDTGDLQFQLEFGPPAERILDLAKQEQSDLIVMGTHGLGGVPGLAPGSVSNRVAHEAPCSVLIVKDGEAPPARRD